MTAELPTYRWNTSAAAEAYDQAAPEIHPYYATVQDQILNHLAFAPREPFELVDLGGGSGRLAERVLERFSGARVTIIDQSEPFLALAERRLQRFAPRATFIQRRLQDDWSPRGRVSPIEDSPWRRLDLPVSERRDHVGELDAASDAIVSTSAIHHLEPAEKRALFEHCFAALSPGGIFINGDEYRPADDPDYLPLLNEWSAHMNSALADGRIPESFRATLELWYNRNIERLGAPKHSGDDCHETADKQIGYLRAVGFQQIEIAWSAKLWAVLIAHKF